MSHSAFAICTKLARARRHLQRFESMVTTNEFLPVQDARNLLQRLDALVAHVRGEVDTVHARLVWIAGRYFEIADDGELDFTIGGLDDDIAVFNGVIDHLGLDELRLSFS